MSEKKRIIGSYHVLIVNVKLSWIHIRTCLIIGLMRYGKRTDLNRTWSTDTMADPQAEQQKVTRERRKDERLEFNCDATVLGFRGIQEITDFSIGGLYLKGEIPDRIGVGHVKYINVKLPTEKYVTRFKAKVMRKTYGGIGCQLIYQYGHEWATMNKFLNLYNFYSDTKSS